MLCPVCQADLLLSEKQGIEIDYCPKCRGIWLDRGELDKIIERSLMKEESFRPIDRKSDYYQEESYSDRNQKKYKKKSFLSDLFDL